MIEFINSLKKPGNVDIAGIRKYSDNTPSVTGLLSLIDSYEPSNEDALARGTYVHKFMEDALLGKVIKAGQHTAYIISALPYLYLFKPQGEEVLHLEKKLQLEGVYGGTADYIKQLDNSTCILDDFKTAAKISNASSDLLHKYEQQAHFYERLINDVMSLQVASKSLFFISPKGCMRKQIKGNFMVNNSQRAERLILVMYYHILNSTHTSDAIMKYIKSDISLFVDILETLIGNNRNQPNDITSRLELGFKETIDAFDKYSAHKLKKKKTIS